MSEAASGDAEIPPRAKVKAPFCSFGNEVFDVFLPIMGANCFTLYAYLVRKQYRNPTLKHSIRKLADATRLGSATVSRSLETLKLLQLIKLTRPGGSKESECQLLDAWVVADRLGAKYESKTLSYSLPPQVIQRLDSEVKALREKQQGKLPPPAMSAAPDGCGNQHSRVSQRNASVSPAIRQRSTRETQTGTHLIREEGRNKEVPSPTPSHSSEAHKDKDSPDEDEPDPLLKCPRAVFTGPMDDLRDHLLDTTRPPVRYVANGYAD